MMPAREGWRKVPDGVVLGAAAAGQDMQPTEGRADWRGAASALTVPRRGEHRGSLEQPRVLPLAPASDRCCGAEEGRHADNNRQHQEDAEQEASNFHRRTRKAAETEDGGNDGDNQEQKCQAEHGSSLAMKSAPGIRRG